MSKGAAAARSHNRGAASYMMNKDKEREAAESKVDVPAVFSLNAHKNEMLPEKIKWRHFGNMSKKIISNQGFKLQTRFAVLTKECLFFTKQPDPAQFGNFIDTGADAIAKAELESVFRDYQHGGSSAAIYSFIVLYCGSARCKVMLDSCHDSLHMKTHIT